MPKPRKPRGFPRIPGLPWWLIPGYIFVDWVLAPGSGTGLDSTWTKTADCGIPIYRGPYPSKLPTCPATANGWTDEMGTFARQSALIGGVLHWRYHVHYVGQPISQDQIVNGRHVIGGQHAQSWEKLVPQTQPAPAAPHVPKTIPIELPEVDPRPAPAYNQPAPRIHPEAQPDDDPSYTTQVNSPRNNPRRMRWPQTTTRLSPNPQPRPRQNPKREPPRPRVRENKNQASRKLLRALAKLFTSMTEVDDFLDCLHGALPKAMQVNSSMSGKVYDLYKNPSSIDVGKAVKCLLYEFGEDLVMGTLNKAAQKALKEVRKHIGADIPVTNPTNVPSGGWPDLPIK